MAIHHFDLARAFSGEEPVAVYTHEYNPRGSWYAGNPAASCVFEMTHGVVFTYRASWCALGCRTAWPGAWRVIGDRGTLLHDGEHEPTGQSVRGPVRAGQPIEYRDFAFPASSFRDLFMDAALREMLTFLRTGKRPQTECHDNVRSLAMVFAAIESARLGRRVPIRCPR
jgi:predicted dehydrogenase